MDGEAPEPIEVELVAHDPPSDRARWRRDRDTIEPVEPVEALEPMSEVEPGYEGSPARDRPRLVAIVAVTAVLALALGWIVGRASEDPVADAPATTRALSTTVPERRVTLPIVGGEIDGPDFGAPDVSVVPGESDESKEADVSVVPGESDESNVPVVSGDGPASATGPTTQPIAVDERLADVPLRLVGVELGGILVEVDLTTGILTDFGADRLVSDGHPLVVGPDWVIGGANRVSRVIRSDGSEELLDLGDRWPHLHVPGTDWFWSVPSDSPLSSSASPLDDDRLLSLVGLDGEPVGPMIELPLAAWPSSVDPATGGVVVTAGMRNYAIGPDGVEHLGDGQLVALTRRTVVAYDCDDALVCGLRRIDRTTGDVAVVPADPDLDEELQWHTVHGWGGASTTAVSPDETWVAVIGSSWRTGAAGLVNLDSGEFVELARDSWPFEVVWSPDGRWAIALADREVIAYDTATGDRYPVFTDPVQWIQLGVRPSAGTEPGAGDGGTLLSASAEEPIEG